MPRNSASNGKPSSRKRIALYTRRSDPKDNFSIEGQFRELREADRGEIVEEVSDPWEKRWTNILKKPGIQRIMALAAAGAIDEVWAWRWDRYGEFPWPELLQMELEEYGVRLRSLDDSGEGEDAELYNGLKSLIAKRERKRIAERSRMGAVQKAKEGKLIASKAAPYGFSFNEEKDNYVINEETMPTLRRIFEWLALDHLTPNACINRLHDEGIPTPTGKKLWDRTSFRNIINNDVYMPHTKEELLDKGVDPKVVGLLTEDLYGISYYGKREVKLVSKSKQQVRWKDPGESIPIPTTNAGIERWIVKAAREAINGSKAPTKNGGWMFQLSGGILVCAQCGRSMMSVTQKASSCASREEPYRYHVCNRGRNKRDDGCSHNRFHPVAALEEEVWEIVHSFLSDPERMRLSLEEIALADATTGEQYVNELARLGEILQNVMVKSEKLLDLYLDGKLSRERYEDKMSSLDAQDASAREEIERIKIRKAMLEEARQNIEEVIEAYEQGMPEDLASMEPSQRHDVYQMLKLKVTMDNDGIVGMEGALPGALPLLSDIDHTSR